MAIIALLCAASMLYGAFAHRNHWPPYHLIASLFRKDVVEPHVDVDVRSLLTIQDAEDVHAIRRALIRHLWGSSTLPAVLPYVEASIDDHRFQGIAIRIDKLSTRMDFGLESVAYYFAPEAPNGHAVIYHQGHRGDFYLGRSTIEQLAANGYAVVALSMPLLGPNNQPIVHLPKHGPVKLTSHDKMRFLAPERGSPIKYFIEPVIAAVNYLEGSHKTISMIGISGGGWTTTLAAAVDQRIRMSFPVAGSYPIHLRLGAAEWGDFEQNDPALYNIANYLELYVLGAHGLGRRQLQVINRFDPCCFSGTRWQTYAPAVKALGRFDVFMDETHREHTISKAAIREVIRVLDRLEHEPAH